MMSHLFLLHLLGSWLLLSQLPRESQGEEMEVFTKCNLDLVRFFIRVCGTQLWAEERRKQQQARGTKRERKRRSGPFAEILPFSAKNEETLDMMTDFIPPLQKELETTLAERKPLLKELPQAALKDINLNFEDFNENSLNRQNEAESKSLSELKNKHLVKHFLKKRQAQTPYMLSVKCCYQGCTKKEVSVFC